MTPVGPPATPPPRPPSGVAPPRRSGGAVSRAARPRPPPRAPPDRGHRDAAARVRAACAARSPGQWRAGSVRAIRLVGLLLVLLLAFGGRRRAPRAGAGRSTAGPYTAFGAVAALPGHRAARRPRLDLRPQRQRPRRQHPAAHRLGRPAPRSRTREATAATLAGLLVARPRRAPRRWPRQLAGDEAVHLRRSAGSPTSVADAVEAADLPGIALLEEPQRFAPAGDLARSVLGQVGVDNDGLSGLELQYDDAPHRRCRASSTSSRTPTAARSPPASASWSPRVRGDDLVLTIDRSMQYETERALAAQILAKGAKGGTAIVTRPGHGRDPRAGQPHHRPRDRARSWPPATTRRSPRCSSPARSTRSSPWPPPSRRASCRPRTELVVPDQLQVGDHLFTDHDPHPTEGYSVTRILTESSNIGTIKLAQMLGKDRFDTYLRRFGFGTKTALDLPVRGRRHPAAARASTTPRRWARSRSARASR